MLRCASAELARLSLNVGLTTPKTFERRVRELVAHHDTLEQIAEALLKARAVLLCEFKTIEKRLVGWRVAMRRCAT